MHHQLQAIAFVVDAADTAQFPAARAVLQHVLEQPKLAVRRTAWPPASMAPTCTPMMMNQGWASPSQGAGRAAGPYTNVVPQPRARAAQGVPLLVLANKQDVPGAASAVDVATALGLSEVKSRAYTIRACSALRNEGVQESMSWLLQTATDAAR